MNSRTSAGAYSRGGASAKLTPTGLRALARRMWIFLLFATGRLRHAKRALAAQHACVVLTLHRVLSAQEAERTASPAGMLLTARTFEALCAYLDEHCASMPLDAARRFTSQPPREHGDSGHPAVALSFDDGWADNVCAAAVARRHGLPMTIFLCTGKMGECSPFWPERVIAAVTSAHADPKSIARLEQYSATLAGRAWSATEGPQALVETIKMQAGNAIPHIVSEITRITGYDPQGDTTDSTMSWSDARALYASGVAFGSHTHTHEILTRIPPGEAARQLARSKAELENNLGAPCRTFSYPNGDWSPEARDAVRRAGYELAFTNHHGVWTRQTDPLAIPRVNLWEGAITNSRGAFSKMAFEYVAFWRPWRASLRESRRSAGQMPERLAEVPRSASRGLEPVAACKQGESV